MCNILEPGNLKVVVIVRQMYLVVIWSVCANCAAITNYVCVLFLRISWVIE